MSVLVVGVVVFLLIRAWMRRQEPLPDDLADVRSFDLPAADPGSVPIRRRRRRPWTREPQTATEAYLALVEDLHDMPDVRRKPGDPEASTPAGSGWTSWPRRRDRPGAAGRGLWPRRVRPADALGCRDAPGDRALAFLRHLLRDPPGGRPGATRGGRRRCAGTREADRPHELRPAGVSVPRSERGPLARGVDAVAWAGEAVAWGNVPQQRTR